LRCAIPRKLPRRDLRGEQISGQNPGTDPPRSSRSRFRGLSNKRIRVDRTPNGTCGLASHTEKEGYRLTRLPGRGRSNVWKVERNGKSQRASFRTTQDRWIAFPPLDRGVRWKTLDEVEVVFVAAVNDRDDPRDIEVYEFPAGEVRDRFNAAYAARAAAHQNLRDDFGMWVGLDADPRGIPASTGSGLANKYKPIAVYPITSLIDAGVATEVAKPDDASDHEPNLRETTARILASLTAREEVEAEPASRATTIAEVLAETRKLVALIAGVAPEAVKLDLKIEY
jgi:hypothetical protein